MGGNVKIAIQNGQFTAPHVCAEMRQVNFRLSCIVSGVGVSIGVGMTFLTYVRAQQTQILTNGTVVINILFCIDLIDHLTLNAST